MIVLTWTVLLLFLGMALDYGIILRYRRGMQNACDSGALAGAHNLPTNPGTAASTATTFATNDLQQNRLGTDTPTAQTLDSNNQPNGTNPDRVRVNIHATVNTYFTRLVVPPVPVAIECTAKVVPVGGLKGLVPVGLDYNQWLNYYNSNVKNGQCDITVPISQRPAFCQTMTDLIGDVGAWGSGNTGEICLPGGDANCGKSEWANEFSNGSPGFYCADFHHVSTVPDPNPVPSASTCNALAESSPGYGTGQVKKAVNDRCAFPAPPASNGRILILALMNPGSVGNGRHTEEIWGFAAFELSCPQNAGKSIIGSFVAIVTYQGKPCDPQNPANNGNCVDTGVKTAILIE